MENYQLAAFLYNSKLVTQNTAAEIAGRFIPKQLLKNEFLLEENKICNDYFFLEKGLMRSFAHDTDGNPVTTNFYSGDHIVFEVSSFFNRIRSQENIQALTNCQGCSISYVELNELFHSLPEFREFGRSVLVKGFTAYKTRMLSMITTTAEERYAALLKNNPEIFQHAALKFIASYLGITDTSLSRIRKEFSKN